MANYKFLFKFIVIGDSSVGKSCLVQQFVEGKANKEHDTTIGIEFGVKEIHIKNELIKLSIWDTAGQESFQSLVRSYYRSAIGVLLVYDITRKETFHNVQRWMEEIKENGNENIIVTLVGNKLDLEQQRQVSVEEGKQLADENHFLFIETSALIGDGVLNAFRITAEKVNDDIIKNKITLGKHQMGVIAGAYYGSRKSESTKLTNKQQQDQQQQQQQKNCC